MGGPGGRPVQGRIRAVAQGVRSRAASAGLPLPLGARQPLRLFPGITFAELVELRTAGTDLTEAVRERAEQTLAAHPNPLGLVTVSQAATLMGRPETYIRSGADNRRPEFPAVVAHVSGARMFLADDVREYARRGQAPERAAGELQDRVYDRERLAETLGMARSTLDRAVARGARSVPPPDGRVAQYEYWLPETVEAWTRPNKRQ